MNNLSLRTLMNERMMSEKLEDIYEKFSQKVKSKHDLIITIEM